MDHCFRSTFTVFAVFVALALGCSGPDENPPQTSNNDASDLGGTDMGDSDVSGSEDLGPDIDPTLDTDEDGVTDLDEITRWGTNPLVADTDGDGFDDFDEIVTKAFDPEVNARQFNPRVADVPKLQIELLNAPAIGLNYTENMSMTKTVGTERSSQRAVSTSRSWGGAESYATEHSHTTSVSVSAEVEWKGASVSATYGYSETVTNTNETTNEWSEEQAQENTRALAQMQQTERQTGVEIESGWLEVVVRISNPSNIAYVLDGVTLTAFRPDPLNPLAIDSVGTMVLLDNRNPFEPTVLSPGDTFGPAEFAINDLDLDTTYDLLDDPKNLVFAPLTFSLRGADDVDLELATTNINARTARVIIDLGPEREREEYRVATVLDQQDPGVTVDEILTDILRIPYETGTADWLYGDETTKRPTNEGLLSLRDRVTSADDTSYWIVAHTRSTNSGANTVTDVYNLVLEGYELPELEIQKGETLHFVYVQDPDRDSLGLRGEIMHGTDPNNPDTDGDGLLDGAELAGWEVEVDGQTVVYSSDPTLADTDRDGVDDGDEFAAGTDPDEEPPTDAPTVSDITFTRDGFFVTASITATSPVDQVARIDVDWGDGSAVESFTVSDPMTFDAVHEYDSLGSFDVTAIAFDRFQQESEPLTDSVGVALPTGMNTWLPFDQSIQNQRGDDPELSWQTVTYGADRYGMAFKSMDMQGSGGAGGYQLLSMQDGSLTSGSGTISGWVYSTGFGHNGQVQRYAGQDNWFNLYTDGSGVSFGLTNGGANSNGPTADATGSLQSNGWTHITGVLEDLGNGTSAVRVYVNGNLEQETIATAVYNTPPSCRFYIGAQPQDRCTGRDADEFTRFRGLIDDVRVFNRALTSAEVEMLSRATP